MSTQPDTPRPSSPEERPSRRFAVGDERWIARLAGEGLGGTGVIGTARFALVEFFREGEASPRSSALLAAGRFADLYDSELTELLAAARPVPPPAG